VRLQRGWIRQRVVEQRGGAKRRFVTVTIVLASVLLSERSRATPVDSNDFYTTSGHVASADGSARQSLGSVVLVRDYVVSVNCWSDDVTATLTGTSMSLPTTTSTPAVGACYWNGNGPALTQSGFFNAGFLCSWNDNGLSGNENLLSTVCQTP
jgi:hypothetical protein